MKLRAIVGPWLLVLLPALLVQGVWLAHNTQLPVSDAAGMLHAAHVSAAHALAGRWEEFLHTLYWVRDWRPTGMYLLEVPFLILAAGDWSMTIAALTLCCTGISLLYVFLLLRLVLSEWEAALGAMLMGLLVCMQWPAGYLGQTEHALMPAVLAACYHLIRSQCFTVRLHVMAFAVAVALAFILRPVESLTHLVPVILIVLYRAWRQRQVSGLGIWQVVAAAVIAAGLLLACGWAFPRTVSGQNMFADAALGQAFMQCAWLVMIAIVIMIVVFYMLCWRQDIGPYPAHLLSAFMVIYSLGVLYYIGFVPETAQWLYTTSAGQLAREIERPSVAQSLILYLRCAGLIPFCVLTLLGIFSLFCCMEKNQRNDYLRNPLLLVLWTIPVTLLLLLATPQYFSRKVMIVIAAWLMVMMGAVLLPGRWLKGRIVALCCLGILQFAGLLWIGTGHPHTPILAAVIGAPHAFPVMVTDEPNPHLSVLEFLAEESRTYNIGNVTTPGSTASDPFLLLALTAAYHPNIRLTYLRVDEFGPTDLPNVLTAEHADGLLLVSDSKEGFRQVSVEEIARLRRLSTESFVPSDRLRYTLLMLTAEGRLETSTGVVRLDCRMLPSGYEACLFRIPPRA